MIATNKKLFQRLEKKLPVDYITGLKLGSNVVRHIGTSKIEEKVLQNAEISFKVPCHNNEFIYCVKFANEYFIILPQNYDEDISFSSYILDNQNSDGYYKYNSGLLTLLWAEELPIIEDDNIGYNLINFIFGKDGEYNFKEIQPYFPKVDVWRIDNKFVVNDELLYSIYISYLCNSEFKFYLDFSEDTLESFFELCDDDTGKILGENIYSAITSTHWRHSFLELYRCLENLYFFPTLRELDKLFSGKVECTKIFESFDIISWKPKEEDAICDLIKTASLRAYLENFKTALDVVQLNDTADETNILARKIYKLRNSIVHWRFYQKPIFSNLDWNNIIKYMCELILDIYSSYNVELIQLAKNKTSP